MFEEVKPMLKNVIFYDVLVGIIISPFILQVSRTYSFLFLLGLSIASLSFTVTGLATKNYLFKLSGISGTIMYLTNFLKIIIICIIGVLIFNNKVNNVIFYIMGFTSHFLALVLYGIVNLLKERK